jgi:YHS domain-containing protein
MRTISAAISLFVLAVAVVSCGGAAPSARAGGATQAEGALKAPGDAGVGDRTTCPVSGEEFIVSATSPRTELEGKTYYFCCAECVQKFEAQPSKYLSRPGAVGQRAEGEGLPLNTR